MDLGFLRPYMTLVLRGSLRSPKSSPRDLLKLIVGRQSVQLTPSREVGDCIPVGRTWGFDGAGTRRCF